MWQEIKNIYHLVKAVIAIKIYGNPAQSMTVIGVTGTDGKTTTATIIYSILKEAGYKTALITTVSAIIGDKEIDTGFHVSTPDSLILQSYLKKAKEMGVTHLVLEVTSHSLDQHRVYGIPFKVGVLTNISREHLDYHKTMERYMLAKAKLFKKSKTVILNKDDSSYSFFKALLKSKKVVTYSKKDGDVTIANSKITTSLPGEFNEYNMLAAFAATQSLGIDPNIIQKALKSVSLPEGRFDIVYDKNFKVIIDFAHTPNSIEKLLQTIKKVSNGSIIHVFGSAGNRDQGKRMYMGEASAKYSNCIILTSEDPRLESVSAINSMIKKGIKETIEVIEIEDRKNAIFHAISLAKKDDTVVITGKGHEKSMNLGKGEVAWSDYSVVNEALSKLNLI